MEPLDPAAQGSKSDRMRGIAFVLTFLLVLLIGFQHIPRIDPDQLYFLNKFNHQQKHSVLLLGDSRIYVGLSPEKFEQTISGSSCYNFGFSALAYSDDYLQHADLLLDRAHGKTAVVLGVDATSLLEYSLQTNAFESVGALSTIDQLHLQMLQHVWMGQDPIRRPHRFMPNGWVPIEPVPYQPTEFLNLYTNAYQNQGCSEVVLQTVCKWIKKWKSEGVTVMALRMPTTTALYKVECTNVGYHPQHVEDELRRAGAIWCDLPNTDTEAYDGSHIGVAYAQQTSEMVAKTLAGAMKP